MENQQQQQHFSLPEVRLALALALAKARQGTKSRDSDALVPALEAKVELLKNEIVVLQQKVKEVEENGKELILHAPSKRQRCQGCCRSNSSLATLLISCDLPTTNNALRYVLRGVSTAERSQRLLYAAESLLELINESKMGEKRSFSQSFVIQSAEFLKDCVLSLLQESSNGEAHAEKITKKVLLLFTKMILGRPLPQDSSGVSLQYHASLQNALFQLCDVPFIGQRLLLIASQQIALTSQMVSSVDPFEDEKVTSNYENIFFILNLVEKICIEKLYGWASNAHLNIALLEEWVECYFQMKETHSKELGVWNLLLVNYTDQIAQEIIKQLHSLNSLGEHFQDSLNKKVLNLMRMELTTS